ncbi:MAG: hypothetical protein IPL26_06870 [Leptospiraceae bacterium]|nr:hypothetical protein [Leptospiraceae bacterium]
MDELELLLHAKRLNLRLDVERLHKHINYTKFIFDIIKNSGLVEIVEEILSPKENPKPE